jgi:DNA-binding NarL/FixJ family response regulator
MPTARTLGDGGQSLSCLVVDDHQLVAQAVGGLLSEQCGLRLVAICSSVAEALKAMAQSPPDLLLLDLNLPGERWQDCAAALQRIKPEARLIILTGMADQFVPPEQIRSSLLAVVDKSRAWDDLASVVNRWQQQLPHCPTDQQMPWVLMIERLSPRERRLLDAIGRGLNNKEIARFLGLSLRTVETYRKSISAKLALSGAELVRAAALYRCTAPHHGINSGEEG